MPTRPSPSSLKQKALNSVATYLELICYGHTKGSKDQARFIHTEGYLDTDGPFVDWPTSLLKDLSKAIYEKRSGHKHLLHLVIQPQLTSFEILQHGSFHVAMMLLQERCGRSLTSLNLVHSRNIPPNLYIKFFGNFSNMTRLNLYASKVDDLGFRTIGETMDQLVELNAGRTFISNMGVKYLCFDVG